MLCGQWQLLSCWMQNHEKCKGDPCRFHQNQSKSIGFRKGCIFGAPDRHAPARRAVAGGWLCRRGSRRAGHNSSVCVVLIYFLSLRTKKLTPLVRAIKFNLPASSAHCVGSGSLDSWWLRTLQLINIHHFPCPHLFFALKDNKGS